MGYTTPTSESISLCSQPKHSGHKSDIHTMESSEDRLALEIKHVMPLVFQLTQFKLFCATKFLVVFSCMRSNFFTLSIFIFILIIWCLITYVKHSGGCCDNCFWNGDWQVKCTKNRSLWLAPGIFLRFDIFAMCLVFSSYLNPLVQFYGWWFPFFVFSLNADC